MRRTACQGRTTSPGTAGPQRYIYLSTVYRPGHAFVYAPPIMVYLYKLCCQRASWGEAALPQVRLTTLIEVGTRRPLGLDAGTPGGGNSTGAGPACVPGTGSATAGRPRPRAPSYSSARRDTTLPVHRVLVDGSWHSRYGNRPVRVRDLCQEIREERAVSSRGQAQDGQLPCSRSSPLNHRRYAWMPLLLALACSIDSIGARPTRDPMPARAGSDGCWPGRTGTTVIMGGAVLPPPPAAPQTASSTTVILGRPDMSGSHSALLLAWRESMERTDRSISI